MPSQEKSRLRKFAETVATPFVFAAKTLNNVLYGVASWSVWAITTPPYLLYNTVVPKSIKDNVADYFEDEYDASQGTTLNSIATWLVLAVTIPALRAFTLLTPKSIQKDITSYWNSSEPGYVGKTANALRSNLSALNPFSAFKNAFNRVKTAFFGAPKPAQGDLATSPLSSAPVLSASNTVDSLNATEASLPAATTPPPSSAQQLLLEPEEEEKAEVLDNAGTRDAVPHNAGTRDAVPQTVPSDDTSAQPDNAAVQELRQDTPSEQPTDLQLQEASSAAAAPALTEKKKGGMLTSAARALGHAPSLRSLVGGGNKSDAKAAPANKDAANEAQGAAAQHSGKKSRRGKNKA